MLYRLVRPMRRKGSRNRYFTRRIPANVKDKIAGVTLAIPIGDKTQSVILTPRTQSVRVSLRTHDPAEARRRNFAVDDYLGNVWQALRQEAPVPLTHRQATALAGEIYRAWIDGEGRERVTAVEHIPGEGWRRVDEPHTQPEEWEALLRYWGRVGTSSEPKKLERALGPLVDRLLLARGIKRVDQPTREILLAAFWQAARDAFETRKRNAEGDYSPDPKSGRFPGWQSPQDAKRSKSSRPSQVSLNDLVEAWWKEAQAAGLKPSTYESYRKTMVTFVALLGHNDASRVAKEDVIRFKDHRLAATHPRTGRPISPKTVKDSDLAGLKTVFGWAVKNGKIPANPAEGVTLKLGRRRKVRSKGFTDAEAVAILTAALKHERRDERHWTFAAKRWVPWLCAYTGARVGELVQLRKLDVHSERKHWIITITPEAGTVKTNEARKVVLHPHLIELGFAAFVQAAPDGHLFLKPAANGDVLGPLQGIKNRLAEFVRTIVTDKNVAPNHGWRHRFKTVGIEAGIEHRILDVMQGHAPRNAAEGYGDVSAKAMADAMTKFPRYRIPKR